MINRFSRHAAGFTAEAFEKLLSDIEASFLRHRAAAPHGDEDDLFELILEDVLPPGADDALEGRIMLLLDDWFEEKQ